MGSARFRDCIWDCLPLLPICIGPDGSDLVILVSWWKLWHKLVLEHLQLPVASGEGCQPLLSSTCLLGPLHHCRPQGAGKSVGQREESWNLAANVAWPLLPLHKQRGSVVTTTSLLCRGIYTLKKRKKKSNAEQCTKHVCISSSESWQLWQCSHKGFANIY